jgi:isoleucyl-tRNA synthetase
MILGIAQSLKALVLAGSFRVSTIDFQLGPRYDPLKVEEVVLKFWSERGIPEKWRRFNGDKGLFAFLEGPPTTNGFPHVGHVRGRTYKDIVLRYQRLKGYSLWVQAGWDEQGLPVEIEVERKLGVKVKKDIFERIGAERFSEECNSLVDHYLRYWVEDGTRRLGLWLDVDNAYETRRPHYIEHVWAFIKNVHEKGLLTEDYRVLPFCPRCETALSDAEVDQGYEDREDPSIFVKFPVEGAEGTYLVIWTTTPWTLVDNEAVAVNPDADYVLVRVKVNGKVENWWLAEKLMQGVLGLIGVKDYEVVRRVKGRELEGVRYIHVFLNEVPVHKSHGNAHYVIAEQFVTLEEGSGLVHIAPAHGPEDFEAAKRRNLPVTNSVEVNGVFNSNGGVFNGMYWLDVSQRVIEELRRKGLLAHHGKVIHRYPHCWRCGTPLIYRTDRQWFIRISTLRGKMVEELSKVKITPQSLRNRFDDWVANIKDWVISRSRVWGTPLPVWRCRDDPGKILVIGSIEELKKLAVELPNVPDEKLVHRPWIDMVKLRTPDCNEWVREPFVCDVWLDSGVAWIAGVDGLRNRELWSRLYPFDWVTEAVDQTRGWFYSLLATSVAWMGKAPYKSILITGHVVDKFGQKMSKSKGNVIWARDLFSRFGADVTRLYLASKAAPWETLPVNPDEFTGYRNILTVLWNSVRFADMYMRLDNYDPTRHSIDEVLPRARSEDRWMLSRYFSRLIRITQYLDEFRIHEAAREWINLVVDDISHGYIRLIRRRVWVEGGDEDKVTAYTVLYNVLKGTLIIGSVFVPFITEYLYKAFVRDGEESVHLAPIPEVRRDLVDEKLEKAYDAVFEAVSLSAAIRNNLGIKLRWPLSDMQVRVKDPEAASLVNSLIDQLSYLSNVKQINVTSELKCDDNHVKAEGVLVDVCLNKVINENLYYEAIAREVVRRVQVMRSKANLDLEERIMVYITGDDEVKRAVERMRDFIERETRGLVTFSEVGKPLLTMDWDIEDKRVKISIGRLTQ